MNLIENALSGNGTRSLFHISHILSLSFETRSDQKLWPLKCRTNKLCGMSCNIDPLPRDPLPQMAYIALLHTVHWEYKLKSRLRLQLGWITGAELLKAWYTVLQKQVLYSKLLLLFTPYVIVSKNFSFGPKPSCLWLQVRQWRLWSHHLSTSMGVRYRVGAAEALVSSK